MQAPPEVTRSFASRVLAVGRDGSVSTHRLVYALRQSLGVQRVPFLPGRANSCQARYKPEPPAQSPQYATKVIHHTTPTHVSLYRLAHQHSPSPPHPLLPDRL